MTTPCKVPGRPGPRCAHPPGAGAGAEPTAQLRGGGRGQIQGAGSRVAYPTRAPRPGPGSTRPVPLTALCWQSSPRAAPGPASAPWPPRRGSAAVRCWSRSRRNSSASGQSASRSGRPMAARAPAAAPAPPAAATAASQPAELSPRRRGCRCRRRRRCRPPRLLGCISSRFRDARRRGGLRLGARPRPWAAAAGARPLAAASAHAPPRAAVSPPTAGSLLPHAFRAPAGWALQALG